MSSNESRLTARSPKPSDSHFVELLRRRAATQGDDCAFAFLADGERDEVVLTYGELDHRARSIAAWLQSHDLQNQRVLLLYPAGLEFIAAFFGCLYAGAVAVPAYPPRRNRSFERVRSIARDADARCALTVGSVWRWVEPLAREDRLLRQLRWQNTDELDGLNLADAWQSHDTTSDTLAFLQYTSGSTGTPRGCMLTHGNLLHNCASIARAFGSTSAARGVFWLPSYHDMGLVGGILEPIYLGSPSILMPPVAFLQRPVRWLQAVTRYRATISGGPNFAYDLCVRKITPEQRESLDLTSWEVAFNGAEPVRAETLQRFVDTFGPCGFRHHAFYPCYGLAEATLLVSGGSKFSAPVVVPFRSSDLERRRVVEIEPEAPDAHPLVGCGQSMPDQEIRIVDPERGTLCEENEIGEIWVRGSSVAQGYWNRPEETDRVFGARLAGGEGPFLRTGDLGFMRGDELFVTGRMKDLLIVRGANHYPQDIEATVERAHPGVRPGCTAVFAVPRHGEQELVIVQEVERTQMNQPRPVIDAIRRRVTLEHELVFDAILLIRPGTIPKTSSGKIQRNACREAFLAGQLKTVAYWHRGPAMEDAPLAVAYGGPHAETTSAHSNGTIHTGRVPENGTAAAEAMQRETVLRLVRETAGVSGASVTLDSTLADLGIDSLARFQLQAALEEHFGGRIPEDVAVDIDTVAELLAAVELYLGGKSERPPAAPTEVPAEHYRIELFPEYQKLQQNLAMAEALGVGNPFFRVQQGLTNETTVIDGRRLISFASYNYLGMSGDPRVVAAAKEALDRYGTSVSASRLVSGEKPVHGQLERAIADWIGTEDSIVYVGGHATNESTIGHLFGRGDLILHDALAHNSIMQGAVLSGAHRRAFPHNDWRALDRLLRDLRGRYRRVLIAIEGVYSMDGDIPDVPRFIEVKRRHKALLLVDEAHSMGTLGAHGRGVSEHFQLNPSDVELWMGTLSKSFGSVGGYIAGSKALVQYLKYTSPGFVFSVGIAPANAAAALESIRILEDEPERVEQLQARSRLFLRLAQWHGLDTGYSANSPVVPVILGNSALALQLSQALFERGINVQPILYPAVEERAARLRFFLTARHSEQQIRHTVEVLVKELARLSPDYRAQRQAAPAGAEATAETPGDSTWPLWTPIAREH